MRGSSGDPMLPSVIAKLLPTPAARDWKSSASNLVGTNARPLNEVIAKLLPTPTATGQSGNQKNNRGELLLAGTIDQVIAKLLPTPTASSYGNNRGGAAGRVGPVRPSLDSLIRAVVAAGGIDWGKYEPAIRRWEAINGPHPFPATLGPKGGIKPAPEFVEWMMALPPGWVSGADFLTINEMLKMLGNGVVPPQAEYAIRQLVSDEDRNEEMMTDTSSFFTTHQTRDVPRDQWGRYKLPGPDGQDKSWTRATTLAATIAEQYALRIWEQRMVVWGLSRRPDLLTMASTISGPEDKKALGEIVDEAHIAAGTKAKANRGTSIHRACQAAERGAFHEVPDELRPHVAKYFAAMKAGGLEILPEYVERTVIVSAYDTAGTFDNLVRCPDGKIRVADKKTGRMDYSDVEFAVQMSLYANADAMFSYDTGRYEPLPEIAKDYAILAHIDPETGDCELQRINIEWGWVWARTCAEVMAIRKTRHIITPYIAPEKAAGVSPLAQARADVESVSTVFGRPLGPNDSVSRDVDGTFRVNGQIVGPPLEEPGPSPEAVQYQEFAAAQGFVANPADPWGSVIEQPGPDGMTEEQRYHAFWAQPFDSDDEPATVNGVPLEQFGAASKQWGCFSGQPCEFTGDEGLHSDGTVCLYGNARPNDHGFAKHEAQESAAYVAAQEPVPGECPEMDDAAIIAARGVAVTDPDELVATIDGLKGGKASVQNVARRLMDKLGLKEGDPGAIKLQQYKIKIARAVVDLAHERGVSIPGPKDGIPDFGVPSGPAPTGESAGAPAPKKAQGDAGAAEVGPAQAVDSHREEKLRTAVESINMQTTIAGLQERHAYYSGTSLGWTEEMQSAARTRAAAIEQEAGQSPLSPLEMIQGATSRQTLTMAWEKATNGGTNQSGWTEEMQAAANLKQTELSAAPGVATSGS